MSTRWRAERDFGRVVGTVLTALGAWNVWGAGRPLGGGIALGLGVLLLALSVVAPRTLVLANRGWMKLAEGLAFVSTRVILGLVYFVLMTPLGLIKRLTGSDPLARRAPGAETYWEPYPARQRDRRHYEKLF